MAAFCTRKRPAARRFDHTVAKPRGLLHPRVQQVGPEHFGIVCFDCAKVRSKLLLADFYGRVLIPPTTVEHTRPALDAAVAQVRQVFAEHHIRDGLVAIERTGRYHRLVQRTFAAAGFETRILHPFVTKQYRQPVDPGNKTDDADLAAIHRATVTGCALMETTRDAAWTTLQLLVDRRQKTLEIQGLEREIAGRLVQTPYILLLSFPGVNVVSAADFAAEAGPIEHYANAKAVTGRAGLRPSRYQSDKGDKANGPLVRACNRSLRAAILGVADNLIVCNHHFQVLATQWAAQGKDPRHTRVKVAPRFCRIAFQMVAGRQVFRHPSIQGRHTILD
jgi:transposase